MRDFISKLAFLLVVAIVWEVIRLTGHYSELLLPGVSSIARAFWVERTDLLGRLCFH